jgi:tetratricopeptide (TPR) repeat protein
MLDLTPLDPSASRSLLGRLNPFHPGLHLPDGMPEEILQKPLDHPALLRQHGWRRVLAFYEEEFFPALKRLPAGREAWRVRYEIGCRIVALRAADEPDARMTRLAAELAGDLALARFEEDPAGDAAVRRQVRDFLAARLAEAAGRLRRERKVVEAREVYVALDRLGGLSPAHRTEYARLLWQDQDQGGAAALPVYLRHLSDHGWNGGPVTGEMKAFVLQQIAIDDRTPQHEIPRRLLLNQSALCSSKAPLEAARHAGLAYLRLDQPERAIAYLERARSGNGHDQGIAAFHLGQALFRTEKYDPAAAAFEQAAEQGYSRARIEAWKGLAYARSARWEEALAAFRQAEVDLGDIQEGDFFVNWGRAAFLMQDVEDAERRFRHALAVEPDNARATHGLAVCLEQQGRRPEAIGLLQPLASAQSAFAPAVHLLGRLLEADGRREEAVVCYRQALAANFGDPVYALFLGLALDEMSDPAALPHLERAAQAGLGGPEVVRQIVLLRFRQGDRQEAYRWLESLQKAGALPDSLARLRARELATEATEAFNAGRYRDAARLWDEVRAAWPDNPRVAENLSKALLCDAAVRLEQGEVDGLRDQIDRAHRLAESFESRLLLAISLLVQGDLSAAQERLEALAAEQPEHPAVAVFHALAACFSASGSAEEELQSLSSLTSELVPAPLLAFLKIHSAARRGDFAAAVQAVDAWVEDAESVRALGLPRSQVNLLVAHCKLRGIRSRRQRIVRSLEELSARYGEGYWDLALALARHHLATAAGLAHAGEADPAALAACDAAYGAFLETASPGERGPALQSHAELLQFLAYHHLQRGDLGAALEALKRLKALGPDAPRAAEKLRKALTTRMKHPSHAKAFSLLARDPDEARTTWKSLLKENPNDLAALHHLACLAWSRAWDEVIEERYETSLPFWREGLEHYRQLYSRDAFWDGLRQKGQALGQTAAHPFREEAFEQWRATALYELAHTFIDLIFHLMTGFELGKRKKEVDPRILMAGKLMEVLLSSKLDAALKGRLSESLADHYLDPDPTRLSSFDASTHRAEVVIDIDPASLKARSFLLRATVHQIDTQRKEGDRSFSRMAKQLNALKLHAEWLEQRMKEMPEDPGRPIRMELTAYYEQLGWVKHDEGGQETQQFNKLGPGQFQQAKATARRIRDCYQGSDTALQKALSLDSLNPHAQETLDHHRDQYKAINNLLG